MSNDAEKLEAFKNLLGKEYYDPSQHDDHALYRFLRARSYDLEASKKMWVDYINWRRENKIDTIIDDLEFPEFPLVRQYYPRMYHRTDKLGRPIYIERLGLVDVAKVTSVCATDKLLKYHIYEYEKLIKYRFKACSIKSGKHIEQSTTILDLKGVSLSSFPSIAGLVKEVSKIAQDYYPEMLGKMYIVNAPMLFSAIWNLVKPFLNEVTVAKISILGSSYKSSLLELIEEKDLPDFLGGPVKADNWAIMEVGPWNDGSVSGYPKPEFERVIFLM